MTTHVNFCYSEVSKCHLPWTQSKVTEQLSTRFSCTSVKNWNYRAKQVHLLVQKFLARINSGHCIRNFSNNEKLAFLPHIYRALFTSPNKGTRLTLRTLPKYSYFIMAHTKWILFPFSCLLLYPQTLPMAFREPTNQGSSSAGREDAQGCEQDFRLTVPLWHSCYGNSILFHSWGGCLAEK